MAANQQVVISGGASPRWRVAAAAPLSSWDRWNYQRTDYLTQPASAKYVPAGVYGAESARPARELAERRELRQRLGAGRGALGLVALHAPGHWIWDPRFGWTWLDDAPWGWAPYHHGRWVFVGPYWAWAPGPVLVRPVYSPALVVFLGGPVVVGRPLYWVPLGWGEPVIRWWGGPRFVGVAWWGGWGGPRVVNNVVIARTATVNVTNITVYHNVNVTNAVVGVPAGRFGQAGVRPVRLTDTAEVRQLAPVRGALEVRPVAASLTAGTGPAAARPPEAVRSRAVVATRAPRDFSPELRAEGLSAATSASGPQPQQRIVPAPARTVTPQATPGGGAAPRAAGGAGRGASENGPRRERGRGGAERGAGQPAAPGGAAREAAPSRQAMPPAPPAPGVQSAPGGQPAEGRAEPKARRQPAEHPGRAEGPARGGNPERGAVERGGGERGGGEKGGPRGERDR